MRLGTTDSCGPPRRVNSMMKRPAAAGRLRGEVIESQRALPCGVSANSVSKLRALCVSAVSLNSQLSTVDSAISTQLPCFDTLAHSFENVKKSPLCFHRLAYSFTNQKFTRSISPITCALSCKYRGCTPLAGNFSEPILEVRPITPIAPMFLDVCSAALEGGTFPVHTFSHIKMPGSSPALHGRCQSPLRK